MDDSIWRRRYEELDRESRTQLERRDAVESVLRKFIQRLSLAARGLGEQLDQVLEKVAATMRGELEIAALEALLTDLSNALAQADTPAVATAKQAAVPAHPAELSAALANVLERLDLDDSLKVRAAELRGQLQAARCADDLVGACSGIAELLVAQRERARLEKADVQRILLQVDARLHEFVSYLRGEAAERQAADDSRAQLDRQMLGEVRELSASVQTATELSSLQRQVAERLKVMDQHLHEFRSREAERVATYRERAERMRSRVEQLESETRSLQASLQREQANATTDALTGIPNRLAYDQRIALEFKRWKRFGRPLSLATWDIDHFKQVNDRYGHQAGDQAIRAVARTLAQNLRETDFVARYGGEEFVVVLVDASADTALVVLDKLRRAIETLRIPLAGTVLTVTASAGVAEFRGDDDPEKVFERADRALYEAKRQGRNRCVKAAD